MRKNIKRVYLLLASFLMSAIAVALILVALDDNIVYFYSPSEVDQIDSNNLIRVGGLVKDNSLIRLDDDSIKFTVTDNDGEIEIFYTGILPDLFREGQGVIAEGSRLDGNAFYANIIMAKHDENYMPKEVYENIRNN
ncbi:MAG: cytochrome c maturation protein CcmE [Alphaproteobacteria bacterium]|nr:cytochrome c maturation protein CcmE [Alphaproteobacteria bacterium]